MKLKFFALGAVCASLAGSIGAQASNINCPTCALQARVNSQKPLPTVLGDENAANVNLGINVSGLLNQASPLQFSAPAALLGAAPNATPYTGQGDLPNAFVRPWELPKSNFDPSFVTDYYTSQSGPIDIPTAPWNLFLPPSIAEGYYQMAMTMLGPVSTVSNFGAAPLDLSPNSALVPPAQAVATPIQLQPQAAPQAAAATVGGTVAGTVQLSPAMARNLLPPTRF